MELHAEGPTEWWWSAAGGPRKVETLWATVSGTYLPHHVLVSAIRLIPTRCRQLGAGRRSAADRRLTSAVA
jgi:hypothetical protein